MHMAKEGTNLGSVYLLNPVSFSDSIGYSIYCYEGIGAIMPV